MPRHKKVKKDDLIVVSGGGDTIQLTEEGQSVTGYFDRTEKGVGKYESNLHHFLDDKESEFSIWGGANIDPILEAAQKGDKLRITFKGKRKTANGQKVKVFEVAGTAKFAERANIIIQKRMKENKKKKVRKVKKSRKSNR